MLRTLLLAIAVVAAPSAARAADYAFDPVHTTANFTATHLAIIKVHGVIPFSSGTVQLGANDLPTSGTATFDMTKLDSGDPNRDRSLRTSYLETDKYPTMTFVVRKATGTPQAFDLVGDLTLHGVTKPVTLKASMVGSAMVKGKRQVGYTATATLDRRDFGITFGSVVTDAPLSVSTDITIDIETALIAQ